MNKVTKIGILKSFKYFSLFCVLMFSLTLIIATYEIGVFPLTGPPLEPKYEQWKVQFIAFIFSTISYYTINLAIKKVEA